MHIIPLLTSLTLRLKLILVNIDLLFRYDIRLACTICRKYLFYIGLQEFGKENLISEFLILFLLICY